ncbi:MAG: hypothetical protein NWR72_08030 [Bacteroidia bacterium]|nr:hypothetical protein [Bacteroidia bacterium]
MKKEKIVSLYVDQDAYVKGTFDVTERLYQLVPEEEIESIKYIVPSSTESGIYFTIVLIEKRDKTTGKVGFKG